MSARTRRWPLLLPVLTAVAIYLVVGASAGTRIGKTGDPSAFIVPGQRFVAPELLPPDTYVYPGTGNDGQIFFYLAQDPLLTGKVASRDQVNSPHIGAVAYRYQRILLPAAWLAHVLGHPRVLEWTLPPAASREELLPVVALSCVLTLPFLTVELWGYIPSYARYGAPPAGMLVLVYAVTRDTAARYLMIALMALTLTNPVVAVLPIANQPAVEVSEAPG